MTRILLVSGSTREGSLHNAALRTAARLAPAGVTASRYDGLRDVPAFVPGDQDAPPAVTMLRQQVEASDALLFCTPEYAGSLPGSLKNLLDWLVDGGQLDGRPAAWLSVAPPGQDDGASAALHAVLEHGGARVLRSACIRIPLGIEAVGADRLIADPRLHTAMQDMLHGLSRSLTVPVARQQPSWQAYSSVFPVVARREKPRTVRNWPERG